MRSFQAVVTDIRLESRVGLAGTWSLTIDPAGFAEGDMGMLEAATRSGTRLAIPVTAVTKDAEGAVWLVVEKPLAAGTEVLCTVSISDAA